MKSYDTDASKSCVVFVDVPFVPAANAVMISSIAWLPCAGSTQPPFPLTAPVGLLLLDGSASSLVNGNIG